MMHMFNLVFSSFNYSGITIIIVFNVFFVKFFRYYYDKNIILKTAGKRYVYRFVCDLQGLLGYSPEEIHQMVDLKLEKKEED